jgi:hypothetical protein
MNIPSSLYETMRLIPPEDIKILGLSELEKFGLYGIDPVFAELNSNTEANLARVSKTELMSRKALSKQCQLEGYKGLRLGRDGIPDTLDVAKMVRECEKKAIYKDVFSK